MAEREKSAASQGRERSVFCGGSEDYSITGCTQKWTVLCGSRIDKSTAWNDTVRLHWYTNRSDLVRLTQRASCLSTRLKNQFKQNQFHPLQDVNHFYPFHLPEVTSFRQHVHLIQKSVLPLHQDHIEQGFIRK